jgi:hypothetical protein
MGDKEGFRTNKTQDIGALLWNGLILEKRKDG